MLIADDQFSELPGLLDVDDIESALVPIRRQLENLYRVAPADAHHGHAHGSEVEQRIMIVLADAHERVTFAEILALRAAALLHDIGYTRYDSTWSLDRREHIAASLDFAEQVLRVTRVFADYQNLRLTVCYLIAHHDDTNYQYPSLRWDGNAKPAELGDHAYELEEFEHSLGETQQRRLFLLLHFLQEADALAGTNQVGAERTFHYSTLRGLPTLGAGNPANAWCWEESAAGNVLLAAKRALIDAYTDAGRSAARSGYDASARFVESRCQEQGKPFIPETFHAFLEANHHDIAHDTDRLTLKRYQPWEALESSLREVTLLIDRSLKPYAGATIQLKRYAVADLSPISKYVLNSQLDQLQRTQGQLCSDYALSLFDLAGIIEYETYGEVYRQAPPVIERYFEPTQGRLVSVIVDGLHRVSLARKLEVPDIWVVEISNIPDRFPVVALPLGWESVKNVNVVPRNSAKRTFRFSTIGQFPNVSNFTSVAVTPSNYLYFFYRDLSTLGSSGIRKTDAEE
jgi:hypothetical protein